MNFSIKKIPIFLHISKLNLKNFNFFMALFPHHLLTLAWSGVSGVAIDIVQGGILHYIGKQVKAYNKMKDKAGGENAQ